MKFKLLIFFTGVMFTLNAQSYSRAKVWTDNDGLRRLESLGVAADHGQFREGVWLISDFSTREVDIMRSNGYHVDILIEDVQRFYMDQNKGAEDLKNALCFEGSNIPVPDHFNLGSMAGFYTYQEMLNELDEMAALYPDLISVRTPISDFLTYEGRPIYHVVISDNPSVDEGEPNVLYTAIHHAREPLSMTQTIFYMWYLLENYETNEEVKFLVDHTRLFFVPCINPDGYIFNEVNFPDGGGMHRKNRRPIGTSNIGVDLNRNYSYQWGTNGISFDPDSDVYPGEFAFSEPETQAIKWLVETNGFVSALNAHSWGDLLLHPIGVDPDEYADHHDYFDDISMHMTEENRFLAQKATFLYPVSGGSDDYMYKENIGIGAKDTIFAMTPEVGPSFWPAVNQIIPYSIKMLRSNLILAQIPHVYYKVVDNGSLILEELNSEIEVKATRLGLMNGGIQVSVEPLDLIESNGSSVEFDLNLREEASATISLTLSSDVVPGDIIRFVLVTDNGSWTSRDTISKIYAPAPLQYFEDASNLNSWTGNWGVVTNEFVSASSSFTDSPFGSYSNNAINPLRFDQELDLTSTEVAYVTFYAKWDIEPNYDKVVFQVSTDGGSTWVSQCGRYTIPGSGLPGGVQLMNEPLYEGIRGEWVHEEIDLSEYAGQVIQIRFLLRSNGNNRRDGFYFDDLKVYFESTSSVSEKESGIVIYPNPAREDLYVRFTEKGEFSISISDLTGKRVLEKTNYGSNDILIIPLETLAPGIYQIYIHSEEKLLERKHLVVIR